MWWFNHYFFVYIRMPRSYYPFVWKVWLSDLITVLFLNIFTFKFMLMWSQTLCYKTIPTVYCTQINEGIFVQVQPKCLVNRPYNHKFLYWYDFLKPWTADICHKWQWLFKNHGKWNRRNHSTCKSWVCAFSSKKTKSWPYLLQHFCVYTCGGYLSYPYYR